MRDVDIRAMKLLKHHKARLNRQQYRTIRGQILAGDGEAAIKGMERLLGRLTW